MAEPSDLRAGGAWKSAAAAFDAPAGYAIRVAGAQAPVTVADLEGLRITTATVDGLVTTELVGEMPDQAALLRLLRDHHAQQLALLDLACLSTPLATAEQRQPGRA